MASLSLNLILMTLALSSLIQACLAAKHDTINDLSQRDTSSVPRTALGSVPYGSIITTCTTPGVVALTFDDGPGPYTAQLLDLLAANNIKATFFLLGNRTVNSNNPDLVRRMYREGHQIASHTWDHQSLESLSSADRQREMIKNEVVFEDIFGFFPTYMRPPYGFCYGASGCLSDMAALGYHVIDWNIDTKDYENDSPTLIQNSKNLFDAGFSSGNPQASSFVPLTHDIHQQTVVTLVPYMIQEIKSEGYKFMTVGECLGDPAENWYRDATTGGGISNSTGVIITAQEGPATSSAFLMSTVSSKGSNTSAATRTTPGDGVTLALTVNLFICSVMVMRYMVVKHKSESSAGSYSERLPND